MAGYDDFSEHVLQHDRLAALPFETQVSLGIAPSNFNHVHSSVTSGANQGSLGDYPMSSPHPRVSPFGGPYMPTPTHPYGSIGSKPWERSPGTPDRDPFVGSIAKTMAKHMSSATTTFLETDYIHAQLYHQVIAVSGDESLAKMILVNPKYVWELYQLDKYDTGVYVEKHLHIHRGASSVVVMSNPKVKFIFTPRGLRIEGLCDELTDKRIKNDLMPILIYLRTVVNDNTKENNDDKN